MHTNTLLRGPESAPLAALATLDAPQWMLRRLRPMIEAATARLIEVLDQLDGDTDLEPDVDTEHNLGWSEGIDQTRLDPGQDDKEPSLGSLEWVDQRRAAMGGSAGHVSRDMDGEEQCEDEGAVFDDEASLGSLEGGPGGTRWAISQPDVIDGEIDREPV